MSPEQAAGEHDMDVRSDVYSLACVVFEMLTGQPPVDHTSLQRMLTQKLTGGYTRLRDLRPDLPAALEAAILTALAPDRAARFASIEEFSRAIAASLPASRGLSARTKWTAAAVALVVLGGGAAFAQHQRRILWATQQVAEIGRLVRDSRLHAAFQLGQRGAPIMPNDSTPPGAASGVHGLSRGRHGAAEARVSVQQLTPTTPRGRLWGSPAR